MLTGRAFCLSLQASDVCIADKSTHLQLSTAAGALGDSILSDSTLSQLVHWNGAAVAFCNALATEELSSRGWLDDATQLGLVHELVRDPAELVALTRELASHLAQWPSRLLRPVCGDAPSRHVPTARDTNRTLSAPIVPTSTAHLAVCAPSCAARQVRGPALTLALRGVADS